MTPAIRSVGTSPGEVERSVRALAEQCGTTEAAIERSLGERVVRVTEQHNLHLALAAARRCLERAGLEASKLGSIVWFGDQPSGLRVQHELGATSAATLFVDGYCSEMGTGLRVARDLVRDDAGPVLVVSEDRFDRPYTTVAPSARRYADLTSDGGSAVLVDVQGAYALSAFGSATEGRAWAYWPTMHALHAGEVALDTLPDPVGVAKEQIETHRVALSRCLSAASLELSDFRSFSVPERIPGPLRSVTRQLGIPRSRVIPARFGHMGRSDVVFDLEQRWAHAEPMLLLCGTPGVSRCVALMPAG